MQTSYKDSAVEQYVFTTPYHRSVKVALSLGSVPVVAAAVMQILWSSGSKWNALTASVMSDGIAWWMIVFFFLSVLFNKQNVQEEDDRDDVVFKYDRSRTLSASFFVVVCFCLCFYHADLSTFFLTFFPFPPVFLLKIHTFVVSYYITTTDSSVVGSSVFIILIRRVSYTYRLSIKIWWVCVFLKVLFYWQPC